MGVIFKGLKSILALALKLLPDSPFRGFIDSLGDVPFIGYLNYFIPISDFLVLLTAWGTAVTLFYVVSAVLRYVRAIE